MIKWALKQYVAPSELSDEDRHKLLAKDLCKSAGRQVTVDELKSEYLEHDVYWALLEDRFGYIRGLSGDEMVKELLELDADVKRSSIGTAQSHY